jgi:hypothetical protein
MSKFSKKGSRPIKSSKPKPTIYAKPTKSKISPADLKSKMLSGIDKVRDNMTIILVSFVIIAVILFFYYNSMSYKVNQSMMSLSKYREFVITGSRLNKSSNRNNKLCDFYIAGAYKPYMTKNQLFDYCSLEICEEILLSGVRSIYIDIFNSQMSGDADPVINNGFQEGEWKLAYNSINFEDLCKVIDRVVFSSGYINNYNDPFILCLNLKTNGNYKCLNKVKNILYNVFGNRLLDNNYTYSGKHIMTTKIKELMGKVVIFCSDGYKNTDLEEFVNFSWDDPGLKKISYESIDPRIENTDKVKLDSDELKNVNKNGITMVTPNDNTYYTNNFNPNNGWDTGCQIVFLNYQKVDENMVTYIEKFKTESFVKKPSNLISTSDFKQSVRMKINGGSQSNSSDDTEILSCPEKPSENYDSNFGKSMLFYKNKGSENLGLCYGVNKGQKCNCDKATMKEGETCNDNLWIKYQTGDDFDICCSSKRINNPLSNCDDAGDNCLFPTKFYFSETNNDRCINGSKLNNIVLQDGQHNFNRINKDDGSGNYDSSEIYKCDVNKSDDINGKKVCLLNKNNTDEKCPNGWNYTGKFDSEKYDGQNINICCKNT